MLPNSLLRCVGQMSLRTMHTSSILSSVFMKKQKKMDPEIAKGREIRKRRKLEREIRELQKASKRPKPVTELELDPKVKENISQYQREPVQISDDEIDRRAVISKEYSKSRARLMIEDDKWIRTSLHRQQEALNILKQVSPALYEAAVAPSDSYLPYSFKGPSLTAPISGYQAPDGDYIDITPAWDKIGAAKTAEASDKPAKTAQSAKSK